MKFGTRAIVKRRPKKCDGGRNGYCNGFACKGRHGTWKGATDLGSYPKGIFVFDEKVENYFTACIEIRETDTDPECKLRKKRGE